MQKMTLRVKMLTPLVSAGAAPYERAELRPPSFKGALRMWYRALDPSYNQPSKQRGPASEAAIFGGPGPQEGQGAFLMRIASLPTSAQQWDKTRYNTLLQGARTSATNGMVYLSYPFDTGQGDGRQQRASLTPGRMVTVNLVFKTDPQPHIRRALTASCWLLGHIGGLGARARRGFGTLALHEWRVSGAPWPECEALLPAHGASTAEEWLTRFENGLTILKTWYAIADRSPITHIVLGPDTRFYLSKQGYGASSGFQPWEHALHNVGLALQLFRQRYGRKGGDYEHVKSHLTQRYPEAPSDVPPCVLGQAPERTAFGLPLTFQYSSLQHQVPRPDGTPRNITPRITFQGTEHDRNVSPLFVRVAEIGAQYHPFFALLDAPVFAPDEQLKDQQDRHGRETWPPPTRRILHEFCDKVLQPKAVREIRLCQPSSSH